jgi:hypothetical protein
MLKSREKVTNESRKFIVKGILKRFVTKKYNIDLETNTKKLTINWMEYQKELRKQMKLKIDPITLWRNEFTSLIKSNKLLTGEYRNK